MDPDCRYDLKGFSDHLGLPLEDIAELFSDFIKEINLQIFIAKTSINDKDLEKLKQVIHNIKGISANYRILDIYEETLKISNALKSDDYHYEYLESLFKHFFVISENAVKEIASYFEQNGLPRKNK